MMQQLEPLRRALCWAHARRKFFELADAAAQLKKRRKTTPVIAPLAVAALAKQSTKPRRQ